MGGLISQPAPPHQVAGTMSSSNGSMASPGSPAARPPTPPPPSSSALNPPKSLLSYFSPMPSPTLIYSETGFSQTDVTKVRITLQSLGIPPELIPRILDHARYWTGCRVLNKHRIGVAAQGIRPFGPRGAGRWSTGQEQEMVAERKRFDNGGGEDQEWGLEGGAGEVWYLITKPLGGSCLTGDQAMKRQPQTVAGLPEDRPIGEAGQRYNDGPSTAESRGQTSARERKTWLREVVVETLSKDQGWSSGGQHYYGTYEASYSWFELSLLRNGREVEGSRHSIQNNVHAGQYMKSHRNVLGQDHPLVRQAQTGDRIVLWIRAQYPGWENNVQEAALTVFTTAYAPDEIG